jgi:hypothetical protein
MNIPVPRAALASAQKIISIWERGKRMAKMKLPLTTLSKNESFLYFDRRSVLVSVYFSSSEFVDTNHHDSEKNTVAHCKSR